MIGRELLIMSLESEYRGSPAAFFVVYELSPSVSLFSLGVLVCVVVFPSLSLKNFFIWQENVF